MIYQSRIVDVELTDLLSELPAVSIEGPKAVGKTATALQYASKAYQLDDPGQLEIVRADPARLTTGDHPILIDEWQRFPASWDYVRRAVDDAPTPGSFILTGSATQGTGATHSGAGRIVSIRMRPMSLYERNLTPATVQLQSLLTGTRPTVTGGSGLTLVDYAGEIVQSGFPALRHLSGRHLRAQLDSYLTRIFEHDFVELGHRVRNQGALRRWATAYAAAASTTATYDAIRDAASSGESDKPAKTTTIPYRNTLEQLWIIEETPAWLPSRNRLRRLATSAVHQLADPALSARLLGVDVDGLVDNPPDGPTTPEDGTLLGALFESLVTQSVQIYAQANEARVSHLRTRGGEHEVDLIVERGDGRVVALEVKLSATVDSSDLRHLRWLNDQIGPNLLDSAVITTGTEAYRRSDGIAVIPAVLLGP